MPRPCSICSHTERLEIDRLLLQGTPYRDIAVRFGLSKTSVSRHKESHIGTDLRDVREVMVAAREEALAQIKTEELKTLVTVKEEIITEARESISARLENAAGYLDQLILLRQKAADILETAAEAGDLKTCLMGIKEARACIEVLAKIEGQLNDSPQINLQQVNIYGSPEWDAVGLLLARILEPYPDLRAEVAAGLQALQEGQNGA